MGDPPLSMAGTSKLPSGNWAAGRPVSPRFYRNAMSATTFPLSLRLRQKAASGCRLNLKHRLALHSAIRSGFLNGQQSRKCRGQSRSGDIPVCLLPHDVSVDDPAITDNVGSARAGGQISHAVSNHGDTSVRRGNPSADDRLAVAATERRTGVEALIGAGRIKIYLHCMDLCWHKAQDAHELRDSLEQSTRDNIDSLAMPPQRGDGLRRSADHFVGIAPCEPSKSRSVGPYQLEAFG